MAPKNLERSCNVYLSIWSSKNELRPEEVFISSNKKCINDNLYLRETPDIAFESSIPNIYDSHF